MDDNLMQCLADMGSTPDAVAQSLIAGGFKGPRGSACECPVAKYLTLKAGRRYAVGMFDARPAGMPLSANTPLPWAVRCFVSLFDRGHYLGLVGAEDDRG